MQNSRSAPSPRAEKRALWEVRQRYQIPTRRSSTTPPAGPPRTPAGRSTPRGRRGPRRTRRIVLAVVVICAVVGMVFGYKIIAAGNKISVADRSILGQLKDLLFKSDQRLQGEGDDRINILLLAIGGEGHKGEELADTIMVASIRPSDNSVALLSIPRDFYVQVPGEDFSTKINAVHAYGESQKRNQGPELLRQKVSEITGLPLHYYARIDFIAFKHIIDEVGGVDITIENTFYDYWHKITFQAGKETMNGERALAYVRARYIEGPEGGDFRRAARQQQVLLALKDKTFSLQTALDFTALNTILNSLSDNIRTDMQLWEMKRFYELARLVAGDKIHSVVLTTGTKGVLVGSTEILSGTPASVLKPRTGDYSEIQTIARNIFSESTMTDSEASAAASPTPSPSAEPSPSATPLKNVTVEIRNGTTITGLAQRTKSQLTEEGFQVTAIGNATNRAVKQTTVYALKLDEAEGARTVAELLKATADSGMPEGEKNSSADILVILGEDANR
jgi:LCP family protein required for cell wall assembly